MPEKLRYNWPKDLPEVVARLNTPDSTGDNTPLSSVPSSIDRKLLYSIILSIVRIKDKSPSTAGRIALSNLSKDWRGFRHRLRLTKRDLRTFVEPILHSGMREFGDDQNREDLAVTLRFTDWLDAKTKEFFRFKLPKTTRDTEALKKLTALDVHLALPNPFPQEKELRSNAILHAIKKPVPLPEATLLRICNVIAFGADELDMSRFRFERKSYLAALKRVNRSPR